MVDRFQMNEMQHLASAMLAIVCAAVMLVAGQLYIQYGSPSTSPVVMRISAANNAGKDARISTGVAFPQRP